MQRAAASAPSTTLQTNSQATEEPPSKRQKTSNGPNTSTTLTSESHLPHPVIDEEGLKRERAIESLGEEAGETKWVLNIVDGFLNEREPSLRTITASYSEIDEESWRPAIVGRRKFGKFNQEKEVQCFGFLLSLSRRLNQAKLIFIVHFIEPSEQYS